MHKGVPLGIYGEHSLLHFPNYTSKGPTTEVEGVVNMYYPTMSATLSKLIGKKCYLHWGSAISQEIDSSRHLARSAYIIIEIIYQLVFLLPGCGNGKLSLSSLIPCARVSIHGAQSSSAPKLRPCQWTTLHIPGLYIFPITVYV